MVSSSRILQYYKVLLAPGVRKVTEDSRAPLVPLATRDRKERRGSLVHLALLVRGAQLGQSAPLESEAAKAPKALRVPKAPAGPQGSPALRDPMGTPALQALQARMDSPAPRALLASRDYRALWGNPGCPDRGGCQACLGCQACQAPGVLQAPQAHQEQQCPWPSRMSQQQHLRPMVNLNPPWHQGTGAVCVLVAGLVPSVLLHASPTPYFI